MPRVQTVCTQNFSSLAPKLREKFVVTDRRTDYMRKKSSLFIFLNSSNASLVEGKMKPISNIRVSHILVDIFKKNLIPVSFE